jgi:hypothetical protein
MTNKIKLPELTDDYIKQVKLMRKDYSFAKNECLKLLETKEKIGIADGEILKKLASNLRLNDKKLTVGNDYWVLSTQIRELLSDRSKEVFVSMNDIIMQAIFWDERVLDDEKCLELPPVFY